MQKNKLIIVGSGIKFLSHLTIEAKTCIEKSDKVLYLINEPVMQEWIKKNSKSSESLDDLYMKSSQRNDNYTSIAEYIIQDLKEITNLCVVIYGHPTVFVQPSLLAAKMALEQGYSVTIMPGISAEDCLFADLMIDPATSGCQSFEATDFLLYRREYDCSSHLIIWQPFVIGVLGIPIEHNPQEGLQLLTEYLTEKYELDHEVVLYEAAQYPTFKPKIISIMLRELIHSEISSLSTLYVKPAMQKKPDSNMLSRLKQIKN
jgi:tetrapyrrole methylase family protein/MazG family protein